MMEDLAAIEEARCAVNTKQQFSWPPTQLDDYQLPQGLHDYILGEYGYGVVDTFAYLFSVIKRYDAYPQDLPSSEALRVIRTRIKQLAQTVGTEAPDVSIVIPVYNNFVYSLTCIVSLLESRSQFTYEIIVADDCSSDLTEQFFSGLEYPIRLVRNLVNLGFLGNSNVGVKHARGRYVVLLNNDTIIMPGWLDELISPLVASPDVGMVGSKLINGDGTLQEAGGIFWADGSAWNFGRDQDPTLPQFNYFKDVDYCSGASIALSIGLWRQLEGFDPIFNPAYCEDSDLAFRVRAAGFRTVYQPLSCLVHHEGRSHGRDTSSGIKSYQLVNQQKLVSRWQSTLQRENFPNGADVVLARDRSSGKPHILIVDHYIPQWDRDAGSRTIYTYIKLFVDRGFHVILWPDNLNRDTEYCTPLQRMGVEVLYGSELSQRFPMWLEANAQYLQYALLSRPHIAEHYVGELTKHASIKLLYYGHDLHFMRIRSQIEVSGESAVLRREQLYFERLEKAICGTTDLVMYPSLSEAEVVLPWLKPGARSQNIPMLIFF